MSEPDKQPWDIDPTPNPMRVMMMELMLADLKRLIKEDPEAAIAHIDTMLSCLG